VGGEALIIDPVFEKLDHFVRVLRELDVKLALAIDTHLHADHVTGLGKLSKLYNCATVMGERAAVEAVSLKVKEGETLKVDNLRVEVIYTPGHTEDSCSFRLNDCVFTGDTLLIRGTGRTDFQAGCPYQQYDSIFNKLLKLPGHTLVYPGHDYKGDTVSTIAEEQAFNPRLQVSCSTDYANIMNNLNLATPKMMDIVISQNRKMGVDYEAR
tara:strand:- start:732 stop:1364 length:633 start_codon:yes stop_codon:yes gene_type:complete